jgi:hypothetical protein
MSNGFGVPSIECKCTYNFTCGYCLRNAPPWHFTPTTVSEQAARPAGGVSPCSRCGGPRASFVDLCNACVAEDLSEDFPPE